MRSPTSLRAQRSNPSHGPVIQRCCFVALLLAMSMMATAENGMKVIGLAGWSGAGKTTLLSRVIPHLLKEGLRVSVIKHAHHGFDVDVPGKDSWVHRQSGATEVLVSSGKRWALMHELRQASEPRLPVLLEKLSAVDL